MVEYDDVVVDELAQETMDDPAISHCAPEKPKRQVQLKLKLSIGVQIPPLHGS